MSQQMFGNVLFTVQLLTRPLLEKTETKLICNRVQTRSSHMHKCRSEAVPQRLYLWHCHIWRCFRNTLVSVWDLGKGFLHFSGEWSLGDSSPCCQLHKEMSMTTRDPMIQPHSRWLLRGAGNHRDISQNNFRELQMILSEEKLAEVSNRRVQHDFDKVNKSGETAAHMSVCLSVYIDNC